MALVSFVSELFKWFGFCHFNVLLFLSDHSDLQTHFTRGLRSAGIHRRLIALMGDGSEQRHWRAVARGTDCRHSSLLYPK
jgi:hypothetical protein